MNVTRGEPWWHDQIEAFIAFLARHAGGPADAQRWKFFTNFHAHVIPSEERMMPVHVWANLALIYEVRCAYGVVFAVYTCPDIPGAIEHKQCVWFTPNDMRALVRKDNKEARASAERFLNSAAALFEEDGPIHTRVSTDAKADPSTKGYETIAKAKRTAGQASVNIYVQTAVMVGRHLCGKPQDEDFGKEKAENLADIAARMRTLVGEAFPSSDNDKCLATIVLSMINYLTKHPPQGIRPFNRQVSS